MREFRVIIILMILLGLNSYGFSVEIQGSQSTLEDNRKMYCDMSAIKLQLKDMDSTEEIRTAIEKKKFCYYLIWEKKWTDEKAYYDFMKKNSDQPIGIHLDEFKKYLGRIYGIKGKKLNTFFQQSFIIDKTLTFEELSVDDKNGFLEKYFDLRSQDGVFCLKKMFYYKRSLGSFVHSANFTAFLLDLGYDVTWDDWSGVLCLETPKNKNEKQKHQARFSVFRSLSR